MTNDKLQAYTKKKLAGLARKKGIAGAGDMRKEELVAALRRVKPPNVKAKVSKPKKKPVRRARSPTRSRCL